MSKELIISDLKKACYPKSNIADAPIKDKWLAVPYKTTDIHGNMLVSMGSVNPDCINLNPELCGMYKIYVALYNDWETYRANFVDLKLTDDISYVSLSCSDSWGFAEHFIEEVLWRCADLTGQEITIGKSYAEGSSGCANVAWFRFVEMTDEEIAEYTKEKLRTDTKKLYATNDMMSIMYSQDMSAKNAFHTIVQELIDSDTEWLSLENLEYAGKSDSDIEDMMFSRAGDKAFFKTKEKYYSYDLLKNMVDYAHSNNIKVSISSRVSFWGSEFPFVNSIFHGDFYSKNKHLRCIDRDGEAIDYLSFTYKEVQDYIIDIFVKSAKTGCDAIQLILSRGWPFVLFEKPFVDMFKQRYGTDPKVLPYDDERIISLKCDIMTEFMKRLRTALDNERKDKKIEIHLCALFSMYDNKYMGIDLERWAKEGLIDLVISDERRIRECLPEEVWTDESHTQIDLEKYANYVNTSNEHVIIYNYDSFFQPMVDSKGVLKGPATQKERVTEFMKLEENYGVKIYMQLMPRWLTDKEIKAKVLDFIECGCTRFGLWDTHTRTPFLAEWNTWKKMGHTDEIETVPTGEGVSYKCTKVLEVGGKSVGKYVPIWAG